MHLPPRGSPRSNRQPFRKEGEGRAALPSALQAPVSSEGGGDKPVSARGVLVSAEGGGAGGRPRVGRGTG